MTVQVVALVCGDGSANYDVVLREETESHQEIWIACVSEDNAENLADAIRDYAMDVRELARAERPY